MKDVYDFKKRESVSKKSGTLTLAKRRSTTNASYSDETNQFNFQGNLKQSGKGSIGSKKGLWFEFEVVPTSTVNLRTEFCLRVFKQQKRMKDEEPLSVIHILDVQQTGDAHLEFIEEHRRSTIDTHSAQTALQFWLIWTRVRYPNITLTKGDAISALRPDDIDLQELTLEKAKEIYRSGHRLGFAATVKQAVLGHSHGDFPAGFCDPFVKYKEMKVWRSQVLDQSFRILRIQKVLSPKILVRCSHVCFFFSLHVPPSPPLQVPFIMALAVNNAVEVRRSEHGEWFSGKISAVAAGTYDITYDAGDLEKGVPRHRIRAAGVEDIDRWIDVIRELRCPFFITGGFPRDLLQGKPVNDVDVSFAAHVGERDDEQKPPSLRYIRQIARKHRWDITYKPKNNYISLGDASRPYSLEGKAMTNFDGNIAWEMGDYCCNSLFYDVSTGLLLDPTGYGVEDSIAKPPVMRIPFFDRWEAQVEGNDQCGECERWMHRTKVKAEGIGGAKRRFNRLYRWVKFRLRGYMPVDVKQARWVVVELKTQYEREQKMEPDDQEMRKTFKKYLKDDFSELMLSQQLTRFREILKQDVAIASLVKGEQCFPVLEGNMSGVSSLTGKQPKSSLVSSRVEKKFTGVPLAPGQIHEFLRTKQDTWIHEFFRDYIYSGKATGASMIAACKVAEPKQAPKFVARAPPQAKSMRDLVAPPPVVPPPATALPHISRRNSQDGVGYEDIGMHAAPGDVMVHASNPMMAKKLPHHAKKM
jgi:hypothetical protein